MQRVQKIIAHAGYCSRRKAETLIEKGQVRVNGKIAKIGDNAEPTDQIIVNGTIIKQEKPCYLLMNKPAGYITTADDPFGRRHVLELVHEAQRVFPVGRLDKDATGLLLLTNDGNFANKVMHPRYEVKKTYEVTLDKKITEKDLGNINKGVVLDRKKIAVAAKRLSGKKVRITLHAGINKVVKRIFKKSGYWVRGLQRTQIGSLKLNVKDGKYRKLSEQEIKALQQ
ncbi:MAG: pseudouridine synthase [Candidatus Woesearchaeota archaeon]|nr:pseudouridine synthase [Candidatus Woesearchaeota archaeon]